MYSTDLDEEVKEIVAEMEAIPFSKPGAPRGPDPIRLGEHERRLKDLIRHAGTDLNPARAAQALLLVAERCRWREMRSLDLFDKALELARKSKLKKEEAIALFGRGIAREAGGEEDAAVAIYDDALALARDLSPSEKADFRTRAGDLAKTLGDSALEGRVMAL